MREEQMTIELNYVEAEFLRAAMREAIEQAKAAPYEDSISYTSRLPEDSCQTCNPSATQGTAVKTFYAL